MQISLLFILGGRCCQSPAATATFLLLFLLLRRIEAKRQSLSKPTRTVEDLQLGNEFKMPTYWLSDSQSTSLPLLSVLHRSADLLLFRNRHSLLQRRDLLPPLRPHPPLRPRPPRNGRHPLPNRHNPSARPATNSALLFAAPEMAWDPRILGWNRAHPATLAVCRVHRAVLWHVHLVRGVLQDDSWVRV